MYNDQQKQDDYPNLMFDPINESQPSVTEQLIKRDLR